jgi:hypothetical protein
MDDRYAGTMDDRPAEVVGLGRRRKRRDSTWFTLRLYVNRAYYVFIPVF